MEGGYFPPAKQKTVPTKTSKTAKTNFFAETEQVAFGPSHVVPGIDFSEDPLLQGRLFSYLDTQLSRLGSPNFHQLPINAPKCPFANMQRDGHMQMMVHKGRGNYEPNSIEPKGKRETPTGFRTAPIPLEGTKVRLRAESFKDHYLQARLFYRSVTPQEQKHMAMALTFELSKVWSATPRNVNRGLSFSSHTREMRRPTDLPLTGSPFARCARSDRDTDSLPRCRVPPISPWWEFVS